MQAEVIQEIIDEEIKQAEKKYGKEVKNLLLKILLLEKQLNPEVKESRLIPLSLQEKYYDYPTLNGMRMKVFNENTNGFKDYNVVHREGKRVFIDEQNFLKWQRRNQEN